MQKKGNEGRFMLETTRTQASTSILEVARQRDWMNEMTQQYPHVVQERDSAAQVAPADLDNLRQE